MPHLVHHFSSTRHTAHLSASPLTVALRNVLMAPRGSVSAIALFVSVSSSPSKSSRQQTHVMGRFDLASLAKIQNRSSQRTWPSMRFLTWPVSRGTGQRGFRRDWSRGAMCWGSGCRLRGRCTMDAMGTGMGCFFRVLMWSAPSGFFLMSLEVQSQSPSSVRIWFYRFCCITNKRLCAYD